MKTCYSNRFVAAIIIQNPDGLNQLFVWHAKSTVLSGNRVIRPSAELVLTGASTKEESRGAEAL